MTGAKRFHGRLLYREAAGEMGSGAAPPLAVGNFAVGEHAMEKPVAVALDRVRDARDVGGIQPDSDDVGHHLYICFLSSPVGSNGYSPTMDRRSSAKRSS